MLRFKIVQDEDFDPATSVDWDDESTAAYVAQFESGELEAFGIIVERQIPECSTCKRGPTWEHGASLWGIDVCVSGPKRDRMLDAVDYGWLDVDTFDMPAPVSDKNPDGSYLAYCLADLITEATS